MGGLGGIVCYSRNLEYILGEVCYCGHVCIRREITCDGVVFEPCGGGAVVRHCVVDVYMEERAFCLLHDTGRTCLESRTMAI